MGNDLTDRKLGDYRLKRLLGRGGMGVVYLAEHVHLGLPYAVKVLPEELAGKPDFVERFREEARVMALLRHPGIVEVHNMSQQGNIFYLAMDYVEGPEGRDWTLADEIHKRVKAGETFSEDEVMKVLRVIMNYILLMVQEQKDGIPFLV